jgi:hypothetical protein
VVAGWFLVSKPSESPQVQKDAQRIKMLHDHTRKADASSAELVAEIQSKGWNLGPEELGSKVLERMTKLVETDHLQLSGFRTEKPTDVANMTAAPFVAVVEGPFSDVVHLLRKVEDPKSKLAVSLLQISTGEGSLGRVTATIGLLAYLPKEVR